MESGPRPGASVLDSTASVPSTACHLTPGLSTKANDVLEVKGGCMARADG